MLGSDFMFHRIIDCIVHPSRIVLGFKDKVWKPIVVALGFLLVLMGIIVVITCNSDFFDRSISNKVIAVLINSDTEFNVELSNNKLSGKSSKAVTDNITVGFLSSDLEFNNGLLFDFKENSVNVYYGRSFLGGYNYENFNGSFNVESVINGAIADRADFSDLIYSSLDSFNSVLRINNIASNFGMICAYSVVIFLLGLLFSYFANPDIRMNVRVKLVLYTLPSFYVVMCCAFLYNLSWLQYVAFILPFIYSKIAFSHIIRIKK